jgi:ferrous iron transport protein B
LFQNASADTDIRQRYVKVALVGNPNSGKSSLFNSLTGLHQKIANFPGVTVEKKIGHCRIYNSANGSATSFEVIDLPGTYSLYPKSPDERIPFEVLCDPENESHPDMVVLLVDGTNLKRSLFLASQVIDLKIPCIIALNMMDLVKKEGIDIQLDELERRLGVRILPINARNEIGIEELKQALIHPIPVPEKDIFYTGDLSPKMLMSLRQALKLNSNYAALQIAHHIDAIEDFNLLGYQKVNAREIVQVSGDDFENLKSYETLERYKVIQDILAPLCTAGRKRKKIRLLEKN